MRKTKIICTIGPASDSLHILKSLISAGMNVARLNLAHGNLEEHRQRILNIRQAAVEMSVHISILLDVKGPEIRLGDLSEPFITIHKNNCINITTEEIAGNTERISISYKGLPQDVKPGARILIDDGLIELKVEEVNGTEIRCLIISGGVVKPHKGVILPSVRTTLPGVTEKDVSHILFGIEAGIDIIALSFVRKAADILQVKELLEQHSATHIVVISKIENEEGVEQLDNILAVSDGIMVARDDLGVELLVEEVPVVQKMIIQKCNLAGKPVIVATHMLESMQINPRPTRAEASDVANAVLDGTDAVMLSGETAIGKYPVEAVITMSNIAKKIESVIPYKELFLKKSAEQHSDITEVVSQSVVSASLELKAKAIITPTVSGFTARMVSKYRPQAPILAITSNSHVLPLLNLLWGVVPIQGDPIQSTDDMFQHTIEISRKVAAIESGDLIVLSAGIPIGKSGSTNVMKIQYV